MRKNNSLISAPATTGNKIQELMSSIESKLDLLASDNFELSEQDILAHSMPNVQPSSPYKQQLQISDLSRTPQSPSPVMNRLDQIQKQYMAKISTLNNQISVLEAENAQLRLSTQELQQKLHNQIQKYQIIQSEQQRIVQRRIEEMKDNLIARMRQEIEAEVQQYINQLRDMRQDLSQERRERKQIQKQAQLLKLQRNNFQELYRQIMNKYKVLMQADIMHHQLRNKDAFNNTHRQETKMQNFTKNKLTQQSKVEKEKNKVQVKKRKSSKKSQQKTSELSKQELIPFITRGIEELKQKLNIQ